MQLLLLTLDSFSKSGGVQQYNRVMGKMLFEICQEQGWDFSFWSAYDKNTDVDSRYLPPSNFRGFQKRKAWFLVQAILKAKQSKVVVITHINLWPIVVWAKKLGAKNTHFIIAMHGIEIWKPLPHGAQKALQLMHSGWPVSQFTAQKVQEKHGIPLSKMQVVYNAYDPLANPEPNIDALKKRLRITFDGPVLLTVCRLEHTEMQKGFMDVLAILPQLVQNFPTIKYVLAGKYDTPTYNLIREKARQLGVDDKVVITDFLPDDQLAALMQLAHVFIMPSTKEGFGIVYVQAAAAGMHVIAIRAGGAAEALLNGTLGILLPADYSSHLFEATNEVLSKAFTYNKMERATLATYNTNFIQESFGIHSLKKQMQGLLLDLL